MIVKITAKRQVTFPWRVLEALGVSAGDRLELIETAEGFIVRPRRLAPERLAPLRGKLAAAVGDLDLEAFRASPRAPTLRD